MKQGNLRTGTLISKHAGELTQLQTLDNALPIRVGRMYRISGHLAADVFRHQPGWIDKIIGKAYPQYAGEPNLKCITVREPVGVAVGITPWNAPLLQSPGKVKPTLASGCCIIMKPSEFASLAASRMAELIAEAGLAPGVFQYLTGDGTAGERLCITGAWTRSASPARAGWAPRRRKDTGGVEASYVSCGLIAREVERVDSG